MKNNVGSDGQFLESGTSLHRLMEGVDGVSRDVSRALPDGVGRGGGEDEGAEGVPLELDLLRREQSRCQSYCIPAWGLSQGHFPSERWSSRACEYGAPNEQQPSEGFERGTKSMKATQMSWLLAQRAHPGETLKPKYS